MARIPKQIMIAPATRATMSPKGPILLTADLPCRRRHQSTSPGGNRHPKEVYAGELRLRGRQLLIDDTGNGGGRDAAFAAASGLPMTLESSGPVGYGFQSSEDEHIDLESIEPRLYLLTRPVRDNAVGR
jgi:hypothetical protein